MSQQAPPQPTTRRPLATVEEVAEFYGIPVQTLYQWRHRRIGPRAAKVGRHLRYRWEDVERYFDELTRAAA